MTEDPQAHDRWDIQDVVIAFGRAADDRDWDRLVALLTDEVHLDYGEPELVDGDELVRRRWAPLFEVLDATQHLTGPVTAMVDGDRARAAAYFQATHVWADADGDPVWTLGGRYELELERVTVDDPAAPRWRLSAVTMRPMWQSGNQTLMNQAGRAAEGSNR